jgi:CNT family concentrative nucleoside transporter
VAGAVALQMAVALVVVRVPLIWTALGWANEGVRAVERATRVASSYMFGYLGGAALPFALAPGAERPVVIAFEILPLVIVTSALAAVLWHWGVLRRLVDALSWATRRTLGVGGAVGLNAGANVFLGVVEAPLVVRAYLGRMTRSELFMVMCLGMSTVSGVVLILYASTLDGVVDNPLGHLVAASLISLPAALLTARLLVPDTGEAPVEETEGEGLRYDSTVDALIRGTMDGLQLFLAIIAILLVVFALVALCDEALALLPPRADGPMTLRRLLGVLCMPVVWLIGVPWHEAAAAGSLLGTKAVLNEYVAYQDLARLPVEALSERSRLLMVYALCGFANFASIGLLVSTIGTLAPERRREAGSLGLKSWLAGNLATAMTGAVIGLVTA